MSAPDGITERWCDKCQEVTRHEYAIQACSHAGGAWHSYVKFYECTTCGTEDEEPTG